MNRTASRHPSCPRCARPLAGLWRRRGDQQDEYVATPTSGIDEAALADARVEAERRIAVRDRYEAALREHNERFGRYLKAIGDAIKEAEHAFEGLGELKHEAMRTLVTALRVVPVVHGSP
jgi:hypothetical protein